jgi:hypothetical protein
MKTPAQHIQQNNAPEAEHSLSDSDIAVLVPFSACWNY